MINIKNIKIWSIGCFNSRILTNNTKEIDISENKKETDISELIKK